MPQLLKTGVAAILITGSTSLISGATEARCLKPAPQTLEAVLAAKPRMFQGVIPYEEFVLHPAFSKEVKNAGNFILTSENKLLRRQSIPKAEEMEIGLETITIRRSGKEITRKTPIQMKSFFALFQAAILEQPLLPQDGMQHRMKITSTGWTAKILQRERDKGNITLSGCGELLHSINLKLRNGQERIIRFKTQ